MYITGLAAKMQIGLGVEKLRHPFANDGVVVNHHDAALDSGRLRRFMQSHVWKGPMVRMVHTVVKAVFPAPDTVATMRVPPQGCFSIEKVPPSNRAR